MEQADERPDRQFEFWLVVKSAYMFPVEASRLATSSAALHKRLYKSVFWLNVYRPPQRISFVDFFGRFSQPSQHVPPGQQPESMERRCFACLLNVPGRGPCCVECSDMRNA